MTACDQGRSPVYDNIRKHVAEIWLIDTHEHFMTEKGRMGTDIDFFSLIIGYMQADMVSSGMSFGELNAILDHSRSLEERWNIFFPYWDKAKNTGYGQCVRITVKGLFDEDDINEHNFKKINDRMVESGREAGWYRYVLKEKSRIDLSVIDPLGAYTHPDTVYSSEFFVRVRRFDNFIRTSRGNVTEIEKVYGEKISSLSDYLDALDVEFQNAVDDPGIVGIKTGLAYSRKLHYKEVERAEAENLFERMYIMSQPLSHEEQTKLADFMMHQVIEHAERHSLPIQIHTGILSRNFRENPIENTNAIHLSNLFLKYRDAKFVIFHGSYPYMAELTYLAKNYPNVYIDMCWMHIVSPPASRRYLEEWLLTVPSNKITAFGGDCSIEWAYGHSEMARDIVSEVLAQMVDRGYYSLDEAKTIATRLLRTNAMELYNIGKTGDEWKRNL